MNKKNNLSVSGGWNEKQWTKLLVQKKQDPFLSPHFHYLHDIFSMVLHYIKKDVNLMIDGSDVGARWSSKTQSNFRVAAQIATMCNKYGITASIDVIRKEVNGAEQSFKEMLEFAYDVGATTTNKNERTINFGPIVVRFIGYQSTRTKDQSKLGSFRGASKQLKIIIFEEIIEFDNADQVQQIKEALGGAGIIWIIGMSNPFSLYNWYISSFISKIDIDKALMDSQGFMFKDWWKYDKEIDIWTYNYINWTNHWVNCYLTKMEHKQLLDLWETDPRRAAVVERGEMGLERGGIYSDHTHKITPPPPTYQPFFWLSGSDVGIKRDATTNYVLSMDRTCSALCVHTEYYHSKSDMIFWINGVKQRYAPRDQDQYATDIVKNVMTFLNNSRVRQMINIKVDNASALNENIVKVSNMAALSHIVTASPCVKAPILKRIDAFLFLLARGRFYIELNKEGNSVAPMLLKELNMSQWDVNLTKLNNNNKSIAIKRMDGKDHGLNGLEYGVGEKVFDILKHPDALFYNK